MLRIGMIGAGRHATRHHLPELTRARARGEVELVAVCRRDPARVEAYRREAGFARAYTDIAWMLDAERLDGLLCLLPIPSLAEWGHRLLDHGVPFLIEKPPGVDLAQARALAEHARRAGTAHMVSANRRFAPFVARAKAFAAARGPVRMVRALMSRDGRVEPRFTWESAFHGIDALRDIAGDLVEQRIHAVYRGGLSGCWLGCDLSFARGGVGHLAVAPTGGVNGETYELLGEGYRAEARLVPVGDAGLRCWEDDRLVIEARADGLAADVLLGSADETAAFLRGLRGEAPLGPRLEEVLGSAEFCAAAQAEVDAALARSTDP